MPHAFTRSSAHQAHGPIGKVSGLISVWRFHRMGYSPFPNPSIWSILSPILCPFHPHAILLCNILLFPQLICSSPAFSQMMGMYSYAPPFHFIFTIHSSCVALVSHNSSVATSFVATLLAAICWNSIHLQELDRYS